MEFKHSIPVLIVLVSLLMVPAVFAAEGPIAYLSEQVRAHYHTNGSLDTTETYVCTWAPCRYGFVEVAVPNNQDVLQYLMINISSKENTNLDSNLTFRGAVASSPTAWDRETVYVNTSDWEGNPGTRYNITSVDVAPEIRLNLTWSNWEGGIDIYDNDNVGSGGNTNTLLFNLSATNPSATKSVTSAIIQIQFERNTVGSDDVINVTDIYTGGATASNPDGGDNYMDRITWTTNINADSTVYLAFNGTLRETVNIAQGVNSQNLDVGTVGPIADKGGRVNWSDTAATITGRTISGKFTRAAIRQGLDLAQDPAGYWKARGFITNVGDSGSGYLTYNITAWYLYEVNSSGVPSSVANQSGTFDPSTLTSADGRIYTTDQTRSSNNSWLNTTSVSKPYYASGFEWDVLWNDTDPDNYFGFINTTYNLPVLYKIDMANTKTSSGTISPDTGGELVSLTDESTHTGSDSAKAKYIQILSVVPANNTDEIFNGNFDINATSVKFYINSTGDELANDSTNAILTIIDPAGDGSTDGLVNITITDLSSVDYATSGVVGRSLGTNEKIILKYDVISNSSMTTGDIFNFTGNTTMQTDSGTPLTEDHPGEEVKVSVKRLTGWKQLKGLDPTIPNLINVTINLSVQSRNSSDYIAGIKFIDYVPTGCDLYNDLTGYKSNVTFKFCNVTNCYNWAEGSDYSITDNGTITLPDGLTVYGYEFINASGDGTWSLSNNEWFEVTYRMNIIIEGTYILPTVISGFDPLTGEGFQATAVGVIRVDIPKPLLPVQITEGEMDLAKRIVVGKPAVWMKEFEVYNPNGRPTPATFDIEVFDDTTEAYATYYVGSDRMEEVITLVKRDGKTYMSWESRLEPFETRAYELRVFTPPVLEIDRDVEVLDKLDNMMVKLKMDVYLKSFAEEEYSNVILNLPIPYENIFEVRDSFGNRLAFTGGAQTSSITVDSMEAKGLKTVTVIYQESYPTIIITPDRDRYDLSSPVSLEILVINGGDTLEFPYIELEIYTPRMDVVYSNIQRIKDMDPLEKTEIYEKFIIPVSAPTGMYVADVRFREDFTTLASVTGNFYVVGAGPASSGLEMLLILLALVVLGLAAKRFRDVRRTDRSRMAPTAPIGD